MFANRKVKSVIAAISATAAFLINTVTSFAAPFGYRDTDDVRKKALIEYLSSDRVIIAGANHSQPEKDDSAAGVIVSYEEISENVEIDYNTIKRANASLEAGSTVVVREGVTGEKTVSYKVKYENGVEVSRTAFSEVVTRNPVDKIVEYGSTTAGDVSDKQVPFEYKYVLECSASAYEISTGVAEGEVGRTATGVPLEKGVIAVDPKVIPLGSRVYIEALDGSWTYGYAVAADTGGAIKGKKVDLCYPTRAECLQFGRRACRVYVLD